MGTVEITRKYKVPEGAFCQLKEAGTKCNYLNLYTEGHYGCSLFPDFILGHTRKKPEEKPLGHLVFKCIDCENCCKRATEKKPG